MTRMKKVVSGLCVLFLLASCGNSPDSTHSYFDSLINSQQSQLARSGSVVSKRVLLHGEESKTSYKPDSMEWKSELEIFKQLSNMERFAYRKSYKMEDGLSDTKSNLTMRRYSTIEDIPVTEVRFYYHQHFENIKRIEAVYHQENLLYTTTRNLVLEFDEVNNKPTLIRFGVRGSQKMFLNDPIEFSIESSVEN